MKDAQTETETEKVLGAYSSGGVKANEEVVKELALVAPLLAVNQKIKDRITLATELK